ncbi:hypothetical protein SAMN05216203_3575 [Marinobacter daqiaonensis]|uniref:Uncharacterized protein n=1 Tax=Marinobacter daqiaonensis TaxID=650891 RepID=A0A1I6K642_9GAMM|nr:hypothetical protein SAMN05216203_3575 [Marinobacter daqiaonensis]
MLGKYNPRERSAKNEGEAKKDILETSIKKRDPEEPRFL